LPSSNLFSHPEKLLEDHLKGVATLAEYFCTGLTVPDIATLLKVIRIASLCHDIGKSTVFFQDYLKSSEKDKEKLKKIEETQHSLLSAVIAFYCVKSIIGNNDNSNLYPLFSFVIVRRHHGNLKNLINEAIISEKDKKLMLKQIDNIDIEKYHILIQNLIPEGLPINPTIKMVSEWVNDISKELRIYKKVVREGELSSHHYIILNLLYSILIDADKSDVVINGIKSFQRQSDVITESLIDNFKTKSPFEKSEINKLREEAYQEVASKKVDIKKRIYSINLPTGLGKTLTSLSFALKFREIIKNKTNNVVPRIIYSLPFLSIIEQNALVFENVLNENNIFPYSNIFLKHHHLSEIFYKTKAGDEFESNAAKIMIEGWNSEIIVTTFVQLFHTLFSNRNRSLRKFHRISNSIIILDEIQSIPIKYWLLVKEMFKLIAEKLNVYFIFVTATEPLIFGREEIVNLVEKEKYFQSINRVVIKPFIENDITLEELFNKFPIKNNKKYLFILNTISAAKSFYEIASKDPHESTFLSTHIVPKERIKRIRDIQKGKYRIVVSTQLVEAGVDIDFDVVVRDIAPLDSINQSSGRCNRNNNSGKGTVHVVSIKNSNNRRFSTFIYDPVLLDITRNLLNDHHVIDERNFLNIIEEYYKQTSDKKSQHESREILNAIDKLRYDSIDGTATAISDFKLIEENYRKRDVFIEVDQEACEVWKNYLQILNIKDIYKRKELFDKIKADFYKHVVSIPESSKNIPPIVCDVHYVSHNELSDYYDYRTGFITKDDKNFLVW